MCTRGWLWLRIIVWCCCCCCCSSPLRGQHCPPFTAMHASVAGMLGKTGSKKTIVLGPRSAAVHIFNRHARAKLHVVTLCRGDCLAACQKCPLACPGTLPCSSPFCRSSPWLSAHRHSMVEAVCHAPAQPLAVHVTTLQHQCTRQMGPFVDHIESSKASAGIGAANLPAPRHDNDRALCPIAHGQWRRGAAPAGSRPTVCCNAKTRKGADRARVLGREPNC